KHANAALWDFVEICGSRQKFCARAADIWKAVRHDRGFETLRIRGQTSIGRQSMRLMRSLSANPARFFRGGESVSTISVQSRTLD
ncbi:MAG: hypothetical protein DMG84_21895, partial [Acidobacteria bacterium]